VWYVVCSLSQIEFALNPCIEVRKCGEIMPVSHHPPAASDGAGRYGRKQRQ